MNELIKLGLFRKLFFSYLLILIISLLFGFIIYQISINIIKESSEKATLSLINQTRSVLDEEFQKIESFTFQLSSNQNLRNLLNKNTFDQNTHVDVYSMVREINVYSYTNNFLDNFYIYLPGLDMILTPHTPYYRIEDYYQQNYYKNISLGEWKQNLLVESHHKEILPGQSFHKNNKNKFVITYSQSLPIDHMEQPLGAVYILIDKNKIDQLLREIVKQYGGGALIADKDNRVITSVGNMSNSHLIEEIEKKEDLSYIHSMEKDNLMITTKSTFNDWTYIASIPKESVLQSAEHIKTVTWMVAFIIFIAGIIISFLFSYRNTVPIRKLREMLKEHSSLKDKEDNDFEFLHGNISKLLEINNQVKQELKAQLPILQDAFLRKLVNGEFRTNKEINKVMEQSNIQLKGDSGVVGIVYLKSCKKHKIKASAGRAGKEQAFLLDELSQLQSQKFQVVKFHNEITILVTGSKGFNKHDVKDVEKHIKLISEKLQVQYNCSLTICFGEIFYELINVNTSFNQAQRVKDYVKMLHHDSDTISFCYDRKRFEKKTIYYYPIELELRLINSVKAGELEETKFILREIYERNFQNNNLPSNMIQQLLYDMLGTTFQLVEHDTHFKNNAKELDEKIKAFQFTDNIELSYNSVASLFENLCIIINDNLKNETNLVIEQVRDYIKENYQDANLTIYDICNKISHSEKYISHLFKEKTGKTVFDYIEDTRIQQASNYLLNSNKTIEEISRSVGYNSAHSFRRAFKRKYGMSPSVYRKTLNVSLHQRH